MGLFFNFSTNVSIILRYSFYDNVVLVCDIALFINKKQFRLDKHKNLPTSFLCTMNCPDSQYEPSMVVSLICLLLV